MIIRHSLQLLEQLSELEEELRTWERRAQELNLKVESEALLRVIVARHAERSNPSLRALTVRKKLP